MTPSEYPKCYYLKMCHGTHNLYSEFVIFFYSNWKRHLAGKKKSWGFVITAYRCNQKPVKHQISEREVFA